MVTKTRGTGLWFVLLVGVVLMGALSAVWAADLEVNGRMEVETEDDATNTAVGVLTLKAKSTGDMTSYFGPSILFQADDNDAGDDYNSFARIHAGRMGTGDDDAYLSFRTQYDCSLVERMLIRHDGRVGIGTSSPGSLLHVNGTARFGGDTRVEGSLDVDTNVNVDGKLTIGTTPTNFPLEIRTNNGNYGAALFFNGYNDADATDWGIQIRCGSQGDDPNFPTCRHIYAYDGDGDPVGWLGTNGAGSFLAFNLSDRDLKEDIAPTAKDCLGTIKDIQVRDFRFRAKRTDAQGKRPILTGFIAQELENVYPEAVVESEYARLREYPTTVTLQAGEVYNGEVLTESREVVKMVTRQETDGTIKAVSYSILVPILVGAVQQQDARIDHLAASIDTVAVQTKSALANATCANMSFSEMSDDVVQGIVDAVFLELGVDRWIEIPFAEAWEEVDEVSEREVVKTVTEHQINWETMAVEAVEIEKTVLETESTGKKVRQLKAGVRFDAETGKFYRRVLVEESGLSSVDSTLLRRRVFEALRQASIPSRAISEVRD